MFKLIACNVFFREVAACLVDSPHVIDVEFTELGEHARSAGLRQLLQSRIDAAENAPKTYDAILLLFGLCGNATAGLVARQTRLVIPRAHDCCTILLGSKQKFLEHFGDNPSTPFSSVGYVERGDYFLRTDGTVQTGDAFAALVAQFGEDDAQYIWNQMHPADLHPSSAAVFIELPETAHLNHFQRFAQQAAAAGKQVRKIPGDIRLIRNLIHGRWNPDEFLIVEPGQRIVGVYDHDQVLRAENP